MEMLVDLAPAVLAGIAMFAAGLYMGRYTLALDIIRFADADRAVFVGDRYYYVLDTRTYHSLQVYKLRCEIADGQRKPFDVDAA